VPSRSLNATMEALEPFLDDFDQITRGAHSRYRTYDPAILIEHDARAQAACTYAHMNAEAGRRFLGRSGIKELEIRGLKLWLFEETNAVVRLKKMDEDGRTRNYPTKQAEDFDRGYDLPNLPMPPVRLTAGYLLDRTNTQFERTQIARPIGSKRTKWSAAIVPLETRRAGERIWVEVTGQGHL
jgi:hypothetical protein